DAGVERYDLETRSWEGLTPQARVTTLQLAGDQLFVVEHPRGAAGARGPHVAAYKLSEPQGQRGLEAELAAEWYRPLDQPRKPTEKVVAAAESSRALYVALEDSRAGGAQRLVRRDLKTHSYQVVPHPGELQGDLRGQRITDLQARAEAGHDA